MVAELSSSFRSLESFRGHDCFGAVGFNPRFSTMKVTMLGKVSTGDPFVIDTKSLRSLQIGNALKADVLFKYAHESIEMFKTK